MYPGSFDPITKGHMNILDKALKIFDKVVIAMTTLSKILSALSKIFMCPLVMGSNEPGYIPIFAILKYYDISLEIS